MSCRPAASCKAASPSQRRFTKGQLLDRRYGLVTVNVTGTPALLPPDEAATVTVEVPAGVPVAGGAAGGLPELLAGGGEESLPLQLNIPTSVSVATNPSAILNSRRSDPWRRRSMPIGRRAKGVNANTNIADELVGERSAIAPPLVLMVRVVFTGPPDGVTVAGLKLHAAPCGKPPQLKLTG